MSTQDFSAKRDLSLIAKKPITNFHVSKQNTKYTLLKYLLPYRTFYVIKKEHVFQVAMLLNNISVFRDKIGYATGNITRNYNNNLIVVDDEFLLTKMEMMTKEGKPYNFVKIVLFDEGLEDTDAAHLIKSLWDQAKPPRFRIVNLCGSLQNTELELVKKDVHPHNTVVTYLNDTPRPSEVVAALVEVIRKEYISIDAGSSIVVFIANLEQDLEIRTELQQIEDYIISPLTQTFSYISNMMESDRPKIVLTNSITDVYAISNVKIVIDSMLEEHNGKLRFISKHRAEIRTKRITSDDGVCYRMISKKDYGALQPYYHQESHKRDSYIAKLLRASINPRELHLLMNSSNRFMENKLDLFDEVGLYDKSEGRLTEAGEKAADFNLKARTFVFLRNWVNAGLPPFPAIVIAGFLEVGKQDYFILEENLAHLELLASIRDRYGYYLDRDDLKTFLQIYMDMLNDYGNVPTLTTPESIFFVQEWTGRRDFDYSSFKVITKKINEIIEAYSFLEKKPPKIAKFNLENAYELSKTQMGVVYPKATYVEAKKGYFDDNGNKYIFGEYTFHKMRLDTPTTIIVLEYLPTNDPKLRLIESVVNADERKLNKPKGLDLFTIQQFEEFVELSVELFSDIRMEDYIIAGNREEIQRKNAKEMEPLYRPWFSDSIPINETVILNDEIYTDMEVAAIKSEPIELATTLSNKALPWKNIDSYFDLSLNWSKRGMFLTEKEFICGIPEGEIIVWIGRKESYVGELLRLFSKHKFVFVGVPDIIKSKQVDVIPEITDDVAQELNGAFVVGKHLNDSLIDVIAKLKPTRALLTAEIPTVGEFSFPDGEIIPVPFSGHTSRLIRVMVSGSFDRVRYNTSAVLDRLYYHNAITRQWNSFPSKVKNVEPEIGKPSSDDRAIDKCYDCAREVEIHLKCNPKLGDEDLRAVINTTSKINGEFNSLYKYPHGALPQDTLFERREKLLKTSNISRRRRGPRIIT